MTSDEQLERWVKGDSVHNIDRDECCPDFSCCQNHYKATDDERRLFRDRPELRYEMLMGFLSGAFANWNVHVAGYKE